MARDKSLYLNRMRNLAILEMDKALAAGATKEEVERIIAALQTHLASAASAKEGKESLGNTG